MDGYLSLCSVIIVLGFAIGIPLSIHTAIGELGILKGILLCLVVLLLILTCCIYPIIRYIAAKRIILQVHRIYEKEIHRNVDNKITNSRSSSWQPQYGYDGTIWNW